MSRTPLQRCRKRMVTAYSTSQDGAGHVWIALPLTVVKLTCNENGDPDILLMARCHAPPGGAWHGSHDGILPQSALPCQRPNWQGQYRYPFAEGTAVHLPRVPEDVQRHHRHGVLPPAHRGRDGEPRRDVARPWVSRASDGGGVWIRRTHDSGLVDALGAAGPSRACVSGRATTGPRTGASRRTARQEAGRDRLDGYGHDGADPAVAGRRGQRAARPAPDPAADRAGAALCDPASPLGLYRWLSVLHPGRSGNLSRSRPHGAGRAAAAAALAQRPDRPSGQTLRASSHR